MADTTALKNRIRAAIKANDNQEITGPVLQQALLDMVDELDLYPELQDEVNTRQQADTQLNNLINGIKNNIDNGYVYTGIATPSSTPATGKVFYVAMQAGTYTNFSNTVVTEGITILKYNGTSWVKEQVLFTDGGVFDVTAHNNNITFPDLNALLNSENLNTLIPVDVRHGGMSIKFVQSSDNKYAQYMLKTNSWSIYINDWERCNDITTSNQLDSDLDISDGRGNALVRFKDGHIKTKNFDSSKNATAEKNGLMSAEDKTKLNSIEEGANASGVKTEDIEHSDLDISDLDVSDGRGNVLVRFKDGHIKTKNFDSKQITSLPLEGKSYSILGDSISTFQGYLRSDEAGYDGTTYAYWYPKTYLNDVNQTWWKKLEKLTGLTLLQNCAWSGSQVCGNSQSTTSAQAGCSTRRITDLAKSGVAPDIIIVLIGINDLRNSDSRALGDWNGNDEIVAESTNVATFSAAYSLMVSKIMTTYPNSEVFCCTILDTGHSGWDTHDNAKYPCMNDRGNTTKEWNDTIRMVSESLGANVLDMHACGIDFFNLDTYTGDRLHPNANGATLMAQKAARELISKSKLTVK